MRCVPRSRVHIVMFQKSFLILPHSSNMIEKSNIRVVAVASLRSLFSGAARTHSVLISIWEMLGQTDVVRLPAYTRIKEPSRLPCRSCVRTHTPRRTLRKPACLSVQMR